MEEQGILDALNEVHLFCFHYVFFTKNWKVSNIGIHPVISDIFDVDNYYCIDKEGPLPELQTNNNVIIPDIDVTFNDTTMNIIQQVNPLENDGNHGIDAFHSLLQLLQWITWELC
jgi:hypothetical protein